MKVDSRNSYVDLTGLKFGRLTAEWPAGRRGCGPNRKTYWLCLCDCGRVKVVSTGNLRTQQVLSCGCLMRETSRKIGKSRMVHGLTGTPAFNLWRQAKRRALASSLPFEITVYDIVIPQHCPFLEIPLIPQKNKLGPNSPSIDKIIPSLGYVRGNIQVISVKANWMKGNATIEEMRLFLKNWEAMAA
jgi:hypothetical protein